MIVPRTCWPEMTNSITQYLKKDNILYNLMRGARDLNSDDVIVLPTKVVTMLNVISLFLKKKFFLNPQYPPLDRTIDQPFGGLSPFSDQEFSTGGWTQGGFLSTRVPPQGTPSALHFSQTPRFGICFFLTLVRYRGYY